MAITYPRALPTHTGRASITLRAVNQTALSFSPFTYKQQIHNHLGQRWEAEVQLPPMQRADAEQWIAFLLSMNGMAGTFKMGDPLGASPRGAVGGTPVVNGAGQTGSSLSIDGCSPSVTGWLKAGDYVMLGAENTATLHKVLQDVDTNSSGETSLDLWPNIRQAPEDGASITTSNTYGRWRLNSGEQDWNINNASHFGITFACIEAITR